MKRLILPLFALALSAGPGLAQTDDAPDRDNEPGVTLMEEGARLFFRGLMDEVEPALRDLEGMARDIEPALRDFAANMGPALRQLLDEVEDWSAYHPPERLPNGDIILRRKSPADEDPPADSAPDTGGDIEL